MKIENKNDKHEIIGIKCCKSILESAQDQISEQLEPINYINLNSNADLVNEDKKAEKNAKNVHRENWKGKLDFFFSTLAYAVGLGAVWRFPYLCYKNGGGVFLIPYFIFLITIGIPLVFLELCVGQFTSNGPLTCWRMTPIFRGIGLSMNFVNAYLLIYYNMILAYSIYFLYYTFANINSELPWEKCNPKWSSPHCLDEKNTFNVTKILCNNGLKCNDGLCYSKFTLSNQTASCNSNDLIKLGVWKPAFPTQDFWNKIILQKSDSIDDTGNIIWQLALCLFISWFIVFCMVVRGIKVTGKLVYFTALFPYVVLIILGIRGWILPGADIGIKYYIYPDLSRLKDYTVWTDAAVQLFFTLNVAYGGLVALSSYNNFNSNIMRDAILVTICNCLTSVFAGFVIFSYLGYIAFKTGLEIHDVVQAGQGLAYVVYPFAVTTIKGGHFWAILFFIMMLVLGIDTMMASLETALTSLFDMVPRLKKNYLTRLSSIILICFCLYAIGIIFCTQAGTYWVEIFDYYSGNWAILLVAMLECISITWFYGYEKFKNDISAMLGEKLIKNRFFSIWKIMWCVLSPLFLFGIVIFSWIGHKSLVTDDYVFPFWANFLGNCLSISTLSGVFIWAIYAFLNTYFIQKKPIKTLFIPDSGWKPLKTEHQILVNFIHNQNNLNEDKKGEKNEACDIDIEKF